MDGYYEGGDGQNAGQGGKGKGINSADDSAKLFVGGLSWETTNDDLRTYFEQFGAVADCAIKTDMNTGRPRGFGFVVFADPASVDQALAVGTHTLSGKTIDPKRAKARGPEPVKKVFVGGLDPSIPESDIRNYFGQFGTIEELILPMDKVNNVRKAFAFITFDSPETVEQLCADSKHMIGDKSVEVKKAVNKQDGGAPGASFGGRGGGRGGYGAPRGGGRGGRGGRGSYGAGGYGQQAGGWDGGYSAMQGYGAGAYDYSGYSAAPAATGYGQPDPYAQTYGQGYDYSGWYGSQQQGGQINGGGYAPRGAAAGASTANARYQPYSR